MADDRSGDSNRVYKPRPQFQNVRVLPNLGVGSDGSAYNYNLPDKPLSDISTREIKATRWDGQNIEEATAVAGYNTDRVKATGKNPKDARQKAHNAASTKKTQDAKSGKRAQRAMDVVPVVGKREVVKINTDPAKGK